MAKFVMASEINLVTLKGQRLLVRDNRTKKFQSLPITYDVIENLSLKSRRAVWGAFINLCRHLGKEEEMDYRVVLKKAGRLAARLKCGGIHRGVNGAMQMGIAFLQMPYLEEDAKNCPTVARAKVEACLRGVKLSNKEVSWLGGLKISRKFFPRPEGLAFKPKTLKDYMWAKAIHEVHSGYYLEVFREKALEVLLKLQHERSNLPLLPKGFGQSFIDGLMLHEILVANGFPEIPMRNNPLLWTVEVHAEYTTNVREIEKRKNAARWNLELPGKDYLPEFEMDRIKTQGALIEAGSTLHHCVGSYADSKDFVHYRNDSVICQVHISSNEVTQCFDIRNSVTEKSKEYEKSIKKALERQSFN